MEIKAILKKPYTDKQRIDFVVIQNRRNGYVLQETEDDLIAWGKDEAELLKDAKNSKIIENDMARDEKLNGGVIYKSVLFDSDTDQKVNLLATVQGMDEEQTIVWYGMDNKPLTCTKEDLINIGGLITSLHSFCWNKNAEIKQEIASCLTVDEVEAINITYEREVE